MATKVISVSTSNLSKSYLEIVHNKPSKCKQKLETVRIRWTFAGTALVPTKKRAADSVHLFSAFLLPLAAEQTTYCGVSFVIDREREREGDEESEILHRLFKRKIMHGMSEVISHLGTTSTGGWHVWRFGNTRKKKRRRKWLCRWCYSLINNVSCLVRWTPIFLQDVFIEHWVFSCRLSFFEGAFQ